MAEKPATPEKTYGYYRVEILAALANAVILTASSVYILVTINQRLKDEFDIEHTTIQTEFRELNEEEGYP